MSEKVSIITPVYNGEKYIRACIESVLAQDYPAIEHIIVDDGSTDATLAIVGEYPRVGLIKRSHSGATAARNAGLLQAGGQFVKFLDADDLLAPQVVSRQVVAQKELLPGQIGYGFGECFMDSGEAVVQKVNPCAVYDHPVVEMIFRTIFISQPLYPRDALLAIKGFDERLRSGQEWNLHIKLVRAGYRFVYQDIFAFRYRHHDSAHRISNRKIDWARELQNFDYSFEALDGISDPEVLDAWAAYLWGFGRRALREGSPEGGKLFFDRARQISGRGFRRFLQHRYCLALDLLGPELTERLIQATRRWRG